MLKRRGIRNPWARSTTLTTRFNPGEAADLMLIATKWKVTPAVVIWAVIAEWLSMCRSRNIMKLPYEQSTRKILQQARAVEQVYEVERQESEGGSGAFTTDVCPLCGMQSEDADEDGGGRDDGHGEDAPEPGDEPGSVGGGPVPGARVSPEASAKIRS